MHHKIYSGYVKINTPQSGLLLLPQKSSTYIEQLFLPTYSKWEFHSFQGFLGSSAGKESAYEVGDCISIPRLGRSAGEGISYPLQYSWASLVAQLVKNPPPMRETWVQSLGWEDPLEKGKAIHSSILAWRTPWTVLSMGSQRVGHN